ncbi:hypothetical protein [Bradyrhizobium sp. sGM-13]|uniref:hypothetical protein n=1 Tax=Bradyrhizobium sp. sGM-13 TaxID=2831781 RepID=UPI001BD09517|nr:hypothetical protein [Bradyrhizobium sp. sGM-13]
MYTRYHQQWLCLHSSNQTFALQQRVGVLALQNEKRRRKTGGRCIPESQGCLFRRLLPRRIDRAGVVDFGDLVIAEAEDLAEALVGVLSGDLGTFFDRKAFLQS